MIAKSIQKRRRINEQIFGTMAAPKRDWWGAAAASPGIHGGDSGALFWIAKSPKGYKNTIKNYIKKRTPQNTNIYDEMVAKGTKNRCQNTSKNNANMGIEHKS